VLECCVLGVTRTQVAWIACASGAAIAALVVWILWHAARSKGSEAFISTLQFLLWILVLSAQAVVWVLGSFMAGSIVRRRLPGLRATGALSTRTLLQIVVAALVLFALAGLTISKAGQWIGIPDAIASAQLGDPPSPLEHANVKLPPIVVVGMLAGMVAIGGMWLVSLAFEGARRGPVRAASINRFVGLRDDLNTLLAIAGVIVGLGALSSGALREAVLAANDQAFYRNKAVHCLQLVDRPPPKERREVLQQFDELEKAHPICVQLRFAREYVFEYGLFFTGLLAIAYAPSFLTMRRAGIRLRNRAYPMLTPGHEGFFDRLDERRRLDEFLQTNLSANASFKAGVAIFTPLAGSVLSLLLPT
jgi:hypothetical protein